MTGMVALDGMMVLLVSKMVSCVSTAQGLGDPNNGHRHGYIEVQ